MTNELAIGMSDLAALLLSADELGPVLDEAAGIVSRMTPGRPGAQLMVTLDSGVARGFSDGARALRAVDSAPLANRSTLRREPTSVFDTAVDLGGPHAEYLLSQGIRSVCICPTAAEGEPLSALVLYSTQSDGFDVGTRETVSQTAAMLTVLFSAAIAAARQAKRAEQLHAALGSRSVIDQAAGILMGRHRCDREQAFNLLRGLSQRSNRKVADLAAEMIEKFGGTPHAAPHFDEPIYSRTTKP